MKFLEFCQFLQKIEKESARNAMVQILAEMFQQLDETEIKPAIYLLLGRVAPMYVGLEFNYSAKSLIKAISENFNIPFSDIDRKYKIMGDVGDLIFSLMEDTQGKGLGVINVHKKLLELAQLRGKSSVNLKKQSYLELLTQISALESKYLTRIIVGNMRLGLSLKTMFDALSVSLQGDKSLRENIEFAYGVKADPGLIGEILKKKGINGITGLKPEPGVPVASKLVEREKTSEAIIRRMTSCYVQPKFDGLRVQIHFLKKGFDTDTSENTLLSLEKEQVRIFSRNMENLTAMLPDVVAVVKELPVDSVILDGEAIGKNNISGLYLNFQETIKRKRKYDVAQMSRDFPLEVNAFDILELNGKNLTGLQLEQRLNILEELLLNRGKSILQLTKTTKVNTEKELEKLFNNYVKSGLEGIIAKDTTSHYDPGTRNFDWIKLKATSRSELTDTVDAVIMGYYQGSGNRAKFGLGALLAGIYDKASDQYVSLAKVGSGLSEEGIVRYKGVLDELMVSEMPKNYVISPNLIPDVIVAPKVVITIDADSISRSKVHGGEHGFSLRFPRLKEFGRDKEPEDTTSPSELSRLCELKRN